jgi:hypothetical protein
MGFMGAVGRYCSHYGICKELRHDTITASHRLQSKVLQERFIETKEYWKRMSKAKRHERAMEILEGKFFIPTDSNADDKCKSFHNLVKQEHLTEEQFATIRICGINIRTCF